MPIIEGARAGILESPGVPGVGTDAVQTLTTTGTPTGGTFKLTFEGFTTAAIVFNASAAVVDAALELLANIGTGGVVCTGGPLPTGVVITFSGGNLTKKAVGVVTIGNNSLTGGATPLAVITNTTPGVEALGRGSGIGRLAVDNVAGKLYINTGTALSPVWTVVGSQS